MSDPEKVIRHLQIVRTWAAVNPKYQKGLDEKECECVVKWTDAALELIESLRQENAFLKDMQKQSMAGKNDLEMGRMAMEALKRQGIIRGW